MIYDWYLKCVVTSTIIRVYEFSRKINVIFFKYISPDSFYENIFKIAIQKKKYICYRKSIKILQKDNDPISDMINDKFPKEKFIDGKKLTMTYPEIWF